MDIDKNYEKVKSDFIANDKLSPKLNAIYEQFIEASSLSNQDARDFNDYKDQLEKGELPFDSVQQLYNTVGGKDNYLELIEWSNLYVPDILYVYYLCLYKLECDISKFKLAQSALIYLEDIKHYPNRVPGLADIVEKDRKIKRWNSGIDILANPITWLILFFIVMYSFFLII
tara:strand:+ start:45 stop:560 length:516 start_codon:yes stop_codon:yes gene_type:complete